MCVVPQDLNLFRVEMRGHSRSLPRSAISYNITSFMFGEIGAVGTPKNSLLAQFRSP